jgi:hypothetical protein
MRTASPLDGCPAVILTRRMDDEGLWRRLLDDPAARAVLRERYTGGGDPMEVLRWRVEPDALNHPRRQVAALERVVHARPTPDTAAATERLRALLERMRADDEALDPALAAVLAMPSTEPARRRRVLVPVLALAIAAVLAAVAVAALQPQPDADPAEVRTAAVATRPTVAPVQPRIVVTPPEGSFEPDGPVIGRVPGGGRIVDQFGLGTVGTETVYGLTTTAGEACLVIDSGEGRTGRCVTAAAFTEEGIGVDRGAWSVTWFADGRVVWTGV